MSDKPLSGERLLKTVVNHILAHPETWDQKTYRSERGTAFCVAGHCRNMTLFEPSGEWTNDGWTGSIAQNALGINKVQTDWLFSPHRTLEEIHYFSANFRHCDRSWTLDGIAISVSRLNGELTRFNLDEIKD